MCYINFDFLQIFSSFLHKSGYLCKKLQQVIKE